MWKGIDQTAHELYILGCRPWGYFMVSRIGYTKEVVIESDLNNEYESVCTFILYSLYMPSTLRGKIEHWIKLYNFTLFMIQVLVQLWFKCFCSIVRIAVYICIAIGDPIIKRVGIIPSHFYISVTKRHCDVQWRHISWSFLSSLIYW
jgi:hypothetical protein